MIKPGETDTATFDVTVNSEDEPGQQIVNQATATFTGLTLGTPFTDTSPQVVSTVAAPSLTLAKSHTGSLIGGQTTTFTLAVSNVGNIATDGSTVTVTDPFPASSFSSIANAGGDGWSCAISELTLTCSRSDVLAAESSYPPILVEATVQTFAPETVVNTAIVSGGGSAPATGSDGGGASGLADVSITKSAERRDRPQRRNGHVHAERRKRRSLRGPGSYGQRSDRTRVLQRSRGPDQPGKLRHDRLVLAGHDGAERDSDDHDHRDGDRARHDADEQRQRREFDPRP